MKKGNKIVKLLLVAIACAALFLAFTLPAFAPHAYAHAAPDTVDVAPADADAGQGDAIATAEPNLPTTTGSGGLSIETIFILGFLIESFVEYIALIFINKTINWKQVAAMIAGVGLAFLLNVDVFALVGLKLTVPYAGVALTGILASRGSNWLADFIKWIQGLRGGGTASVPNE